MSASRRLLALGLVVATGLGVRALRSDADIPFFIWKYLGSALWATAVYLAIGLVAPRLGPIRAAAVSGLIAVAVELSRLLHLVWLDAFRATLAGRLLIGKIFALSNLVAYAAGIMFGMAIEALSKRRTN